jgi:hypothetical protein
MSALGSAPEIVSSFAQNTQTLKLEKSGDIAPSIRLFLGSMSDMAI